MEWSTIIGFVVAASSGLFVNYLAGFFVLLMSCLGRRYFVRETRQVQKLDQLFVCQGFCQSMDPSWVSKPADGWVAKLYFWEKTPSKQKGCFKLFGIPSFVVGFKTTVPNSRGESRVHYDLTVFGRNANKRLLALLRNVTTDRIPVTYCDQPSGWHLDINTVYRKMQITPKPWQAEMIALVTQYYFKHGRSSVFLHGAPGLGKSEFAFLLGNHLTELGNRQERTANVIVANLTDKGLTLASIIGEEPSKERVKILLLNEFDSIALHALKCKESKSETRSLATNKSTLCDTLDRLSHVEHLIVVATSNHGPDWFSKIKESTEQKQEEEKEEEEEASSGAQHENHHYRSHHTSGSAFIRPGRFDLQIAVK